MKKKFQMRRRYLVKKKFQLKYVGLILTVMFISALITGYTVYYNAWALLGDRLANVYPQARLVYIFKFVNIRLAIILIFTSLSWIGIGILVSHKIAGPVFRMIRFLDDVTKGDYSQRLRLRKGDELKDLAESINRLVYELDKQKNA